MKHLPYIILFMLIFLFACSETTIDSSKNSTKSNSLQEKESLTVNSDSKQLKTSESLQTFAFKIQKNAVEPMDVPLINQMDHPRLYNGCEVSSLAMILQYHGYETTKNELAEKIPSVPLTYENGLKGNPNKGFVGDMADGPGLSVYHGPIHDLAKQYVGDRAIDLTGKSVDTLYQYVSQGLPVWIITTANFVPVNDFQTWNTPSGKVDVTFSVHSVVITGYDENHVYINNPYGQKNQKVERKNFEKAWKQMGSQAVVITN
ncbi:C39 family peptidase [Virgibacillus doumboii]|uniref:C39 family peptidase n=1 Tax=Virgibacillus doumboii TaxID=2697503 RepID=UPI0013E0C823|nr:C39 family peptidase [Virgibacillus doumboii]